MELSRRGMLGGVGAALAVGGVGFVGAASVTDETSDDGTGNDGTGDDGTAESGSVPVDPDAPFEAQLLGDGDHRLFDAGDLDRVQGVIAKDDEHLVYVSLGDAGVDALQAGLADAGATDEPERFAVSMTLDGTEVRRVDLDEATVSALTDEEWGGVVTLPFSEESVAQSVYDSLADA
ncbi:hypothetical protein [Halorubrum sp. N11]|uniref:hypothetical protein n=1 Tax=Halorubrum sp. N11 TaxID=3402276 RepID=UPI003EBA3043